MPNMILHSHNSLWSPAMRIMNRLNYHKKFSLLLFIFALPLVFLVYLLFSEINIWRDFARKEREGVVYIQALREFLEPLQQHRGLLNATRHGDNALRPRLPIKNIK